LAECSVLNPPMPYNIYALYQGTAAPKGIPHFNLMSSHEPYP
jgi:hypothetical protein